ncbi:MAG TPA: thiamine pyrophosphate-dependent enzyme [Candidatus Limnocylindria bacterium]|nr:thiamine pyrophosphate-dependent enzyme [Candidatus Limnocylindria bacterium]
MSSPAPGAPETLRNAIPYPFCPGCGHGSVLDRLNEALVRLGRAPERTVIVSDIGCSGLSDQYFTTSAFHGLHGRSVTYATGVKLADPSLEVIVVMGDGGTGIGGTHLLNAARRNVGITVVVMNNLNFGMTGGQHSTTTPEGAVTATTPGGNLEHPLDICATVGVNGAAYAYRGTQFDPELAERLVEAIETPGFALLDVWELCTAHYVKANRLSRRGMEELMEELNLRPGVLFRRDVAEYATAYRRAHGTDAPPPPPAAIPVEFAARLDRPRAIVVAGSAGGRVRSAARLVGEAAIRSGLWAVQRDDYPVTVQTGYSLAELVLSPSPQALLPVPAPDVLVVLSTDGLRRAGPMLASMTAEGTVVTVPGLAELATDARVVVLDPGRVAKGELALTLLAATVARLDLLPIDALRAAAAAGPFSGANLAAVAAGAVIGAVGT